MTIGERIRLIRKASGLTQKEFGQKISLVASAICQLENGLTPVTDRVIRDICREYGLNREWLEHGTGEMHDDEQKKETLAHEFADILMQYPSLYETAKMVSKHMTQSDWRRASELLNEMGG